jgi:hypothetical protein
MCASHDRSEDPYGLQSSLQAMEIPKNRTHYIMASTQTEFLWLEREKQPFFHILARDWTRELSEKQLVGSKLPNQCSTEALFALCFALIHKKVFENKEMK